MKCPKCDGRLGVIDSRSTDDSVRRRRKCPKCQFRSSTIERVEKQDIQDERISAIVENIRKLRDEDVMMIRDVVARLRER